MQYLVHGGVDLEALSQVLAPLRSRVRSLSLLLFLSLSLSYTHTLSLSHPTTHSLSLSLSLTHTRRHSRQYLVHGGVDLEPLNQVLAPLLSLSPSLSFSLSLSLTHSFSLSIYFSFSETPCAWWHISRGAESSPCSASPHRLPTPLPCPSPVLQSVTLRPDLRARRRVYGVRCRA